MIHVLTPFSRHHNLPFYLEHLAKFGVLWHPLIHDSFSVPTGFEWVRPIVTQYPEEWNQATCYWKLNYFLEHHAEDGEFYCVLCDDDAYEPSFFDKIKNHSGSVIIASMFCTRNGLLMASKGNAVPSRVGFQQLVIRGDIFKKYRYANDIQSDGFLIEKIALENEVDYAPEAFVIANIL